MALLRAGRQPVGPESVLLIKHTLLGCFFTCLPSSGQQLQCGTSFMADLSIKECKVQPRRISSLYWKRPCFLLGNIGFLPSWYRDPLVVNILLDDAQLKVYHRVVIYRFTDFCGGSRAPLHRALCHSVRTSSLNILENITITFLQH